MGSALVRTALDIIQRLLQTRLVARKFVNLFNGVVQGSQSPANCTTRSPARVAEAALIKAHNLPTHGRPGQACAAVRSVGH